MRGMTCCVILLLIDTFDNGETACQIENILNTFFERVRLFYRI